MKKNQEISQKVITIPGKIECWKITGIQGKWDRGNETKAYSEDCGMIMIDIPGTEQDTTVEIYCCESISIIILFKYVFIYIF